MRSRRTHVAIAATVVLSLVTAVASGTAAATTPARPGPTLANGRSVVQFAETSPMPLPWNAHLLSNGPAVTTASGPRAAADADGGIQLDLPQPRGRRRLDGRRLVASSTPST